MTSMGCKKICRAWKKCRPVVWDNVDVPSGLVTFHFHLPDAQGIRQVPCQLNRKKNNWTTTCQGWFPASWNMDLNWAPALTKKAESWSSTTAHYFSLLLSVVIHGKWSEHVPWMFLPRVDSSLLLFRSLSLSLYPLSLSLPYPRSVLSLLPLSSFSLSFGPVYVPDRSSGS